MSKKAFLIILDGWGHGENPEVSAIAQAHTPYIDSLYRNFPNAELVTYGEEVGLPEGQMGNSEVGHLNIGAGRIVYQELARINKEIKTGAFAQNPILKTALEKAKLGGQRVHLMGLLSDGGVHSHINHLKALCDVCMDNGLGDVFIHAFLDGRDTSPTSGKGFLSDLMGHIEGTDVSLATVIGRYYAMDRDKRWERTKKAYDLLVRGEAEVVTEDIVEAVTSVYTDEVTDEFMPAIKNKSVENGEIRDGDLVICFNFRTDRPRQIVEVLSQQDFSDHDMRALDIDICTMTMYDKGFKGIEVIYHKEDLKNTLGEVISKAGLKQLRLAETEKYPHVTFFFSGGIEAEMPGEIRALADSPKVATYDLQPEMSAYELTNKAHTHIIEDAPEFIILNYANADMVGHTGVMSAAIKSAEVLDACMESLIPIALSYDYTILIIADHGNSDIMVTEDGTPHTAHTTNPVPLLILDRDHNVKNVLNGKLADIAPTILGIMGFRHSFGNGWK